MERPRPTPEGIWQVPLTRRQLLKLAGATAFLSSCSSTPERAVRRTEGIWSREEIIRLGREMMGDSDLRDVAYSGDILVRNQKRQPSLSLISPLFEDTLVTFETRKTIDDNPVRDAIPIKATLISSREWAEVRVGPEVIRGSTKMGLGKITIGANASRDLSDFALKFFVAKEVFNALALEDVTTILSQNIFLRYGEPPDLKIKNAIRLAYLDSFVKGVPVQSIMDIWAHYYLVPDFNRARDKGLFPARELNGDELRLFHTATRHFTEEGLLKGRDEGYAWNMEAKNFWNVWFDFAFAVYRALTRKMSLD